MTPRIFLIDTYGFIFRAFHARARMQAPPMRTTAGVPTEVRVWPGQIHDFQLAAPVVPEATRSLRQIGEYIREATG